LVARGRKHDETGQAAGSALLLIVVLIVLVIAVVLLQRTASTATAINKKASVISKTGVGINDNTDSILQLTHTNALASSILNSAKPLQNDLSQIVGLGNSINSLATTINGSATTINGTATSINNSAGAINATATGINTTAGQILAVSTTIRSAVAMINTDLVTTINVATEIRGDTDAIVGTSNNNGLAGALHEAGCINHDLGGNSGTTC
jgi:methyl-accepting chemotaxis protein